MPGDTDDRGFDRLRRQVRRDIREEVAAAPFHLEGVVARTLPESRQDLEGFVARERQELSAFLSRERWPRICAGRCSAWSKG